MHCSVAANATHRSTVSCSPQTIEVSIASVCIIVPRTVAGAPTSALASQFYVSLDPVDAGVVSGLQPDLHSTYSSAFSFTLTPAAVYRGHNFSVRIVVRLSMDQRPINTVDLSVDNGDFEQPVYVCGVPLVLRFACPVFIAHLLLHFMLANHGAGLLMHPFQDLILRMTRIQVRHLVAFHYIRVLPGMRRWIRCRHFSLRGCRQTRVSISTSACPKSVHMQMGLFEFRC